VVTFSTTIAISCLPGPGVAASSAAGSEATGTGLVGETTPGQGQAPPERLARLLDRLRRQDQLSHSPHYGTAVVLGVDPGLAPLHDDLVIVVDPRRMAPSPTGPRLGGGPVGDRPSLSALQIG
jgi:hypothetical protein